MLLNSVFLRNRFNQFVLFQEDHRGLIRAVSVLQRVPKLDHCTVRTRPRNQHNGQVSVLMVLSQTLER